jgi:hypothetical protein
MGQGSSSSVTNIVDTSIASKILTNSIMSCKGNSNVSQILNISGIGNVISGVKQANAFKLSSTCNQDIKDNKQLQQELSNQLASAAEAKGSGITSAIGASNSDVYNKISTDISSMLENNTIANIVNNVNQLQGIDISGNNNIVKDFNQQMTSELVFSSVQNALNNLSSIQAANNALQSTATAITTNPISDLIDSVFNGLQGLMKYWVVLVLGILLIIGIMFRDQIKTIFCLAIPICSSNDETENKNKNIKLNHANIKKVK